MTTPKQLDTAQKIYYTIVEYMKSTEGSHRIQFDIRIFKHGITEVKEHHEDKW